MEEDRAQLAQRMGNGEWRALRLGDLGQRRAREPFTGLDDVLFSPLSMATLVRMLPRMLASPRSGVFNLGSRDGMSKAAFEMALGSPCPSLHSEIERVERGDASAQQ